MPRRSIMSSTGSLTYSGPVVFFDDVTFKNDVTFYGRVITVEDNVRKRNQDHVTKEMVEKAHNPPVSLKVKKLKPGAIIPTVATSGSAGMDLTAINIEYEKLPWWKRLLGFPARYTYGTGLAFEIPTGYVGLIFPRSSVHKYDMTLSNCVGVIDSDYRGEVTFVFKHRRQGKTYKAGERVGQLILMKLPLVEVMESDDLSSTERGTGGYGSTGS